MSMVAAGSYIRKLREEQNLTQAEVIARMAEGLAGHKIDPTTLWRIESGRTRPRSDLLSALVAAVGGNDEEVARLYRDETSTKAEGEAAALRWLRRDQIERIDALVETTPPDELALIIDELRAEYQQDPGILTFLRGALAGWRARGAATRRG